MNFGWVARTYRACVIPHLNLSERKNVGVLIVIFQRSSESRIACSIIVIISELFGIGHCAYCKVSPGGENKIGLT